MYQVKEQESQAEHQSAAYEPQHPNGKNAFGETIDGRPPPDVQDRPGRGQTEVVGRG